jgi:hypothetical protein
MTRHYPGEEYDTLLAIEAADDEERAQDTFYTALAAFRSACQDTMALSEIMRDQIAEMLAWMDGEVPCREIWNERIIEQRRVA